MLKIKNKCVNTIIIVKGLNPGIIITSSQGLEHKHCNFYGMTIYSTFIFIYKMFMMASLFLL